MTVLMRTVLILSASLSSFCFLAAVQQAAAAQDSDAVKDSDPVQNSRSALASDPTAATTFSLAVKAINSVPVVGDGVPAMSVAPGDIVTVVIYVRDWSPDGEQAAALQVELDPDSYTSGTAGSIKPVAYDVTTLHGEPNDKNAFIDLKNERFIHYGRHAISFVQNNSVDPGYRWISVVVSKTGPAARQDGKKFYFGTLKLYVSRDARGTFEIMFIEGVEQTAMRTPDAMAVEPVFTESVKLTVDPKVRADVCWITGSTPPFGAIDARSSSRRTRKPWDRVELRMSCDASGLSADDFELSDGTSSPPLVQAVTARGRVLTLQLNAPIGADTWTRIMHKPSTTFTRLGRLQGDVSGDSWRDAGDLAQLIRILNKGSLRSTYHNDVDGNDQVNAADLLELLVLIDSESPTHLPVPTRTP